MTLIHLPAFYLGVREELDKQASMQMDSMPVNENILPTISKQTKWRYARTKDGLKLTDGNLVYSFGGLPEEFPAEDTRIGRHVDDNILNFDKDAISKGTAQIHRSSPDNIYMTLANGMHNPTFMLQHEGGKNWRYSPAKKFVQKLKALSAAKAMEPETVSLDPSAMLEGAQDTIKQADITNMLSAPGIGAGFLTANSAAQKLQNIGSNLAGAGAWMGRHPIASGLGLYGLARNMVPKFRSRVVGHPEQYHRTRDTLLPIAAAAVPTTLASAFMQGR
jgi:hypothetical protein